MTAPRVVHEVKANETSFEVSVAAVVLSYDLPVDMGRPVGEAYCTVVGVIRFGGAEIWRTRESERYGPYSVPQQALDDARHAAIRHLRQSVLKLLGPVAQV